MSDISYEASELVNIGRQLGTPFEIRGHNQKFIVPDGFELRHAAFNPDAPIKSYVDSQVEIHELDSFTRYVKRFQSPATLVFLALELTGAVINSCAVTAIFDYHSGRKDGGDDVFNTFDVAVGRGAHRATYTCPVSFEWSEWSKWSGKRMNQEDFAKFLEDHTKDITKPDGASILEMVMNFEQAVDVRFESKIARQGGLKTLSYRETEATAKRAGSLQIPEKIELFLPVFRGGEKLFVEAKINFKVTEGSLALWYELVTPHEAIYEAVERISKDIESENGILPIAGKPPVQK